MHRHAPKRHAVLSFMVAHEGCDRLGQKTDDSGSGTPKHRFDRQHPKIEPVGSSHSPDRVPPLTSGTPKNHALTVNRDIDGPLPRLGSAPKRRRWWSPTEEIGWSRTQEIRWYPTQEIGWVRSEEILHAPSDLRKVQITRPTKSRGKRLVCHQLKKSRLKVTRTRNE